MYLFYFIQSKSVEYLLEPVYNNDTPLGLSLDSKAWTSKTMLLFTSVEYGSAYGYQLDSQMYHVQHVKHHLDVFECQHKIHTT